MAQAKAGAHWQLSIGADVKAYELIKSGSKIINGVAHQAPFYHVSQSVLREVSVVAVGADASTTMKIAASFNFFMNDNLIENNPATGAEINGEVEAAIKAERNRVTAIQEVCNGEFPEIEREAIQAG